MKTNQNKQQQEARRSSVGRAWHVQSLGLDPAPHKLGMVAGMSQNSKVEAGGSGSQGHPWRACLNLKGKIIHNSSHRFHYISIAGVPSIREQSPWTSTFTLSPSCHLLSWVYFLRFPQQNDMTTWQYVYQTVERDTNLHKQGRKRNKATPGSWITRRSKISTNSGLW